MVKRGDAATLAMSVRNLLRQAILGGEFEPGETLNVANLGAQYEVSTGVVREALVRLTEQSLVINDSNRRFSVTTISRQRLQDMTELRIVNEQLALRWSLERSDLAWETELIAAHHRLTATARRSAELSEPPGDEWTVVHRAFHRVLASACESEETIRLCARAFDWAEFHQRWAARATEKHLELESDHDELLSAALARDIPRAMAAVRGHHERTAAILLASGLFEHAETP